MLNILQCRVAMGLLVSEAGQLYLVVSLPFLSSEATLATFEIIENNVYYTILLICWRLQSSKNFDVRFVMQYTILKMTI